MGHDVKKNFNQLSANQYGFSRSTLTFPGAAKLEAKAVARPFQPSKMIKLNLPVESREERMIRLLRERALWLRLKARDGHLPAI